MQDKSKRELVDLKNQADSLAYQSEKQLKDAPADKLPADVKSKVWRIWRKHLFGLGCPCIGGVAWVASVRSVRHVRNLNSSSWQVLRFERRGCACCSGCLQGVAKIAVVVMHSDVCVFR